MPRSRNAYSRTFPDIKHFKSMQRSRSVDRRASLTTLDEDVTLQILGELAVDDVISLRKTSKDLTFLSRLRTVWYNALISNVLSRNMPIPSLPPPFPSASFMSSPDSDLQSLSSEDLEVLTRESLAVHANWTSPAPIRTFSARLKVNVMKVLSVKFLPSPMGSAFATVDTPHRSPSRQGSESLAGRFFLTFGFITEGLYSLQVWDAEAALDSNSTSSSSERVCHEDEEDSDNVKLVGEWLGRGRATGVVVCDTITPDEGALIGFCYVYQDRQFTAQRTTLRIFSFSTQRQDTEDTGIYSREDSLRSLRTLTLVRPVILLALTETRVILQVDAVEEFLILVRDWKKGWTIEHNWEVVLRPSKHGTSKAVLIVRVIHDFILVFRESVVDIYFLPSDLTIPSTPTDWSEEVPSYVSLAHTHQSAPWSPPSSSHSTSSPAKVNRTTLRPSASYKWTWPINSLAVTERFSWHHEHAQARCRSCDRSGKIANSRSCSCVYRPLSLAIRFDSYFPWPVNLIHHFVIHTSPSGFDPATLNPLDFALPLNGAPHPDSEKVAISPFLLPPQNTHTIPSSVRLFGRTALVLGAHGTLVWLDSESDYVPLPLLHQGEADRVAHASAARNTGEGEETVETEGYAFAAGTGERIASIQMPLTIPSAIELRTSNVGSGTSVATSERVLPSLIAARTTEGWTAVAADERAGRIVAGDSEGFIEVWDYY